MSTSCGMSSNHGFSRSMFIGASAADWRMPGSRGNTILRLRVALENDTSASARVSPPVRTPDRLETALSLAEECELLGA